MTPSARRNLLSYIEDLPRFGPREACLWKDGARWRARTYDELHRRSLACSDALGGAGLKPGDPVLIQGPDGADWIEALFGTLRAGGVAGRSARPDRGQGGRPAPRRSGAGRAA